MPFTRRARDRAGEGSAPRSVLAIVIGVTITDPWVSRLEREAVLSSEEEPSAALIGVINDPLSRMGTVALMTLIVVLMFIMVVKPFS